MPATHPPARALGEGPLDDRSREDKMKEFIAEWEREMRRILEVRVNGTDFR